MARWDWQVDQRICPRSLETLAQRSAPQTPPLLLELSAVVCQNLLYPLDRHPGPVDSHHDLGLHLGSVAGLGLDLGLPV